MIEKLRSEEAIARLARVVLDDALSRPAGVDARPHFDALRAAATVEAHVPPELAAELRRIAERPFALDRDVLLAVVDRAPVRALLRELLVDALLSFGKRLRAPVAGLGGLAEQIKSRTGALGALAGSVVGAVSQEFERQIADRAVEFADAAVSRMLQKLADHLCDPARAEEQAELRRALLDGVLALDGARATGELERLLRAEIERVNARPLGELLDSLGLRADVERIALQELTARLRALVHAPAFAAWVEWLQADA